MMKLPRRAFVARTLGTLALWPLRPFAKTFGYRRLMQGPMIGHVGPTHLTVWGRANGPYTLQVEYSTSRDFSAPQRTQPVAVSAADDYAAAIRIGGLRPSTRYYYRVLVDGVVDRYQPTPYHAMTAPAGAADFRVAFGSCARYTIDPVQRVFDGVMSCEPDLFFWLGDNVYADSETAEGIAEEYRRGRNVERLQPLLRSVPQLAIWDDHDFGYNNSDGTNPYKETSLEIFRHYWANPSYGLPHAPGVFFEYSYGGIDFFFLDGRYYRDPDAAPDGPQKTHLGAAQKRWLKERLAASRAPFKVLIAGTGWSSADGPHGDTWSVFITERNEIFDFIRDQRIGGVVLLSGDSHVGEINCIPWSERGGYDLYDLVSSPLAQSPANDWVWQSPEVRMRSVYSKGPNFGLLEFRHAPEPTLTFTLHDATGARVWAPLVLRTSDLRNGVSTWRAKIDPKEMERRTLAGRQGP